MDYYLAIKKNTFESILMRWMKLEPIIQSEVGKKEKYQCSMEVKVKVAQWCLTLCDPMDYRVSEHWSGQPFPFPEDFPNLGIEPRSLALQVDSLPAEPQGKPRSTGVGSLFLLQGVFLTQELNWGLLHCRQILYQLSYQGIPHVYGIQKDGNDGPIYKTAKDIDIKIRLLDSGRR